MSLPVWPATVQHRPRRDAFRMVEPHVAPHETDMEGGTPRRRPRATVTRQLFAFAWDWEDAEFGLFHTFYHVTLAQGSLRFTMPVFDGSAYAARTCQFKGMYEPHRPGKFWRVTAQLYVWRDA